MKIFVTGSTGLVGTALIPKLVAAGHTVVGLTRSQSSIANLEALGAKGVHGTISDLDVCAAAARDADVVAHLAFDHDLAFSGNFPAACEKDRAVIKAMCDALVASSTSTTKTFIVASGTLGLLGSDEFSEPHKSPQMPRYQSTDLVFSYVPKGLRAIQIRLAPVTYGPEKLHDFIKLQLDKVKANGYAAYIDSPNAWSTCHVNDMADLYTLVIAADGLPNPCTLHGVAEEGVPLKDVTDLLARKVSLETKVIPKEKIMEEYGFVGMLMTLANKASSNWTREKTGWKPKEQGLLAQMETYSYA